MGTLHQQVRYSSLSDSKEIKDWKEKYAELEGKYVRTKEGYDIINVILK